MRPRANRASSSGIPPLLLVLVLAARPAPAVAQDPDDPLAGFDYEAVRAAESEAAADTDELPTRKLIRDTQDARAICNQLVDDINGLAGLWEQVRRDTMDRETFSFELGEARKLWEDHGAECRLAHRKLPQQSAITTLTLVWEVEQIERVWEPLATLGRAWIDEEPRPAIDAAAATYRARLTAYAGWLEAHARFWDGAWLDPDQPRSCLDDARGQTQELAASIRVQMVLPHADREEAALREMVGRRRGVAKGIEDCRAQELTDLQQVELTLLDATLRSYGQAIDGLQSGDARRLEIAMNREQEITARWLRCSDEHASGGPISAACRPGAAP